MTLRAGMTLSSCYGIVKRGEWPSADEAHKAKQQHQQQHNSSKTADIIRITALFRSLDKVRCPKTRFSAASISHFLSIYYTSIHLCINLNVQYANYTMRIYTVTPL